MHRYRVLVLALAVFLVGLLGAWLLYSDIQTSKERFLAGSPPEEIQKALLPRTVELSKMRPPALRSQDYIRYGSATSIASVVEFGDYECETCKETKKAVDTVLPRFGGRVRFVWRDLPVSDVNPNARDAAIFARCAGQQGKFWEAHDALFASPALGERTYSAIAGLLGLNTSVLAQCRADPAIDGAIDMDTDTARNDGVTSAPFFFIGTKAVRGAVTPAELEQAIKLFLAS